jgi:hypothetical protein
MKNKYRKLAVIMLTAVCFAGCQQEDIVYPEPDAKVAETYLTLNELTQSPLQVPGPEGTYILKVISDDKWTLSSSQAWCSVSETEGFKYSQVPVSYSENPWNEPRTAELTFLINESQEIKIVTVEQEASETSLAADSKELQYNIGGGEKDITLQTNAVEWNVEVVDEPTHTPVKCINGKTNCSTFTKHFVPNLILLTQNKMCILLRWFHLFSSFVYLCISLA